jgi:hypothetical protein
MKNRFNDIHFQNEEDFNQWLSENYYIKITLEDHGQDIQLMYIHESGEILHCYFHSTIYNGKFIQPKALTIGKPLYIFNPALQTTIKYNSLVVESIQKNDFNKTI